MYDPTIGQFIDDDPIEGEDGDSNPNEYSGNDPTNPSGIGRDPAINRIFFSVNAPFGAAVGVMSGGGSGSSGGSGGSSGIPVYGGGNALAGLFGGGVVLCAQPIAQPAPAANIPANLEKNIKDLDSGNYYLREKAQKAIETESPTTDYLEALSSNWDKSESLDLTQRLQDAVIALWKKFLSNLSGFGSGSGAVKVPPKIPPQPGEDPDLVTPGTEFPELMPAVNQALEKAYSEVVNGINEEISRLGKNTLKIVGDPPRAKWGFDDNDDTVDRDEKDADKNFLYGVLSDAADQHPGQNLVLQVSLTYSDGELTGEYRIFVDFGGDIGLDYEPIAVGQFKGNGVTIK